MKLVFATNNLHKLQEVQRLMPPEIELMTLKEIGCLEEIEETATTLAGNAQIKTDHVKQKYGYDCFGDDTGLEVESVRSESVSAATQEADGNGGAQSVTLCAGSNGGVSVAPESMTRNMSRVWRLEPGPAELLPLGDGNWEIVLSFSRFDLECDYDHIAARMRRASWAP